MEIQNIETGIYLSITHYCAVQCWEVSLQDGDHKWELSDIFVDGRISDQSFLLTERSSIATGYF